MSDIMNIRDYISKIKVNVVSDIPYLYGLTRGVDIIPTDKKMEAYTDGRRIYMSKDIIKSKYSYFIYAHELMHIAFLHPLRMNDIGKELNQKLYNLLADYRINKMLECYKGYTIPSEEAYKSIDSLEDLGFDLFLEQDELHDFKKYSTEYIYYKLSDISDKLKEQLSNYNKDVISTNTIISTSGDKVVVKKDCSFSEEEVKEMLSEGQTYAKIRGFEKGIFEEEISNYLNNSIRWEKIVVETTKRLFRKEKDYKKISKKSNYEGYPITPKLIRKKGVRLFIGVDTSGSMETKEISFFFGSLLNLVRRYKAVLKIMLVDCERQSLEEIKCISELKKYKLKGRGGTSFKPFMEYIDSSNIDLAVIFTDGCGDQTQIEYSGKCKIYWIITKDGNTEGFNFGRVLKMR